jgi:hypothetical protein
MVFVNDILVSVNNVVVDYCKVLTENYENS